MKKLIISKYLPISLTRYHCLNCNIWFSEEEFEHELLVKKRFHCIDTMEKN